MTIKTTKPNRCKHCKERMPADKARHVIHDACIDPWLALQNAKKARLVYRGGNAGGKTAISFSALDAVDVLSAKPVLKSLEVACLS